MKDGGIYADTDVALNTNLETFLTPSLSFFVPRDSLSDFAANATTCLWNGLIGAAPGHPFLAKAVEKLLTYIVNRADYYDLERALCHTSGEETELWKARTLPILMISGPCMLGAAVNEALGRRSALSKHSLGLGLSAHSDIEARNNIGDFLLLAVGSQGGFCSC